jgi:hypothetical protein
MTVKFEETTRIDGLYWKKNFYVGTGVKSFTLVANKGPIVADILFFEDDTYYNQFSLQIGQINRYTFFGRESDVIKAEFVDCRANSPTLHQKVLMEFSPDPRVHLVIERGIAARFSGFRNTTIRSEPILYATTKDNGYNVGNDRIIIPNNSTEFPIVRTNKLPLPNEALQFLLKKEQEVIQKSENKRPSYSYDTFVNGEMKRINIKPKAIERG